MKWIKHEQSFMVRRGFRGRYLTIYVHTYWGNYEPTERLHSHPWKLAISILLKGWLREHRLYRGIGVVDGVWQRVFSRFAPSISTYKMHDEHRVIQGQGCSLFIGLFRTQVEAPNATVRTKSGWVHYSELSQTEYEEWNETLDG